MFRSGGVDRSGRYSRSSEDSPRVTRGVRGGGSGETNHHSVSEKCFLNSGQVSSVRDL